MFHSHERGYRHTLICAHCKALSSVEFRRGCKGNCHQGPSGCSSMSKRKYEVPEHFKELVRSALQKPKVALHHDEPSSFLVELPSQQPHRGNFSVSSSSSASSSSSSNASPTKLSHQLPIIPASSFYSANERLGAPPRGAAAASPKHGTTVAQFMPAEPAYLRLIQLYKQRSSLFGAERRQHCFRMFAKLKEALEFANQQTNCRVFAQEGRKHTLTCIINRGFQFFPV